MHRTLRTRIHAFFLVGPLLVGCSTGESGQQDSSTTATSPHGASHGDGSSADATEDSSGQLTQPEPAVGWGDMTPVGASVRQFDHEMSAPVLAMNNEGYAIAAWSTAHTENEPRHPHLMVSVYQNHAWQPAMEVTPDPASDPVVAINDRGDMVVSYLKRVYDETKLSHSEERWVRYAEQGVWKDPQRVGSADPTGKAGQYGGQAAVFLDKKGQAVLVYHQFGPVEGIYAVHQSTDHSWSAPFQIAEQVASNLHTLSLSGNAEGQAMLVWLDASNPHAEGPTTYAAAKAKAYDQGVWQETQILGDYTFKDFEGNSAPLVKVDSQGNAIAMFTQNMARQKPAILTRDYNYFTKQWSLAKYPAPDGHRAYAEQALAMNRNGDAAIVWTIQTEDNKRRARLSYRPRGQQSWGQPLDFIEHPSPIDASPIIAMTGQAQTWIAWDQPQSSSPNTIHLRRYDPLQGLQPTATPTTGTHTQLTTNRNGQAIVLTKRTVIGNNPLGHYAQTTATVYTPKKP